MKRLIAIILSLLLSITCFATAYLLTRAEKPIPISEQLGLRPIDPTPIAVALVSPDAPAIHAKNTIESKNWRLFSAEFLPDDGVLELSHDRKAGEWESFGNALSRSFPIKPGCYLFQIDQKTLTGRSQVTVGDASLGFFQDSIYANWNQDWMTFSHFFRVPETEDRMRFGITVRNFSKVHVKNIHLLPAQALLNLAPQGLPLEDIYWGKLAVSRTEPTGEFLPLGRMEGIRQDYTTKQSIYLFQYRRYGGPWGVDRDPEWTIYPSASIEVRPIKKLVGEPVHTDVDKHEEVILKFELRPVSIGTNGEFSILPPIRFLSADLSLGGNYVSDYAHHRDGIFWSTDGETWNDMELKEGRYISPTFPAKIFPCERLYIKLKPVAGAYDLSRFDSVRFEAKLDTDQYHDYGQTSYFRVVPGETQENGMTIHPLYTARNQVYFLFRNDTRKAAKPEFSARLGYSYSAEAYSVQTEPKEVVFHASGNTTEAFDDIACRWEVLGNGDKIPPGKERICVFTLETSKLRASSHAQYGPSVSDVFSVEFDLGTYKMLNERMCFFPPRLVVE